MKFALTYGRYEQVLALARTLSVESAGKDAIVDVDIEFSIPEDSVEAVAQVLRQRDALGRFVAS